MLFNSIDFAIFFPIFFFLYWFVFNKNIKTQNLLILIASYFFYGYWDWRFLFLIFFSTIVDFTLGKKISETSNFNRRKIFLSLSLIINLGFLGVFKYYNFFLDNFVRAFSFLGKDLTIDRLNIILPVGISFYTFQTLSYTIDIFNKKIIPEKNFIHFASFVSFFPQLVAGPIERASNLLPQFSIKRIFTYEKASLGLRQVLWGCFKKIVIADNCAEYVNLIFNNYTDYNGSTLFIGAFLFSFQIYCDFSGYSDIAIGISKILGFELKQNFSFPYFSKGIVEFWRRWHISLSTWFRDYLYIPLGGSKGNKKQKVRNIFIIFIISGFWHGANWTFVFWGFANALLFIPTIFIKKRNIFIKTHKNINFKCCVNLLNIISTFFLITILWIFFRSENINQAFYILNNIFSESFFELPIIREKPIYILLLFFILIEWLGKKDLFAIEKIDVHLNKFTRWIFYSFVIFLMGMYMPTNETPFIYFQF